MSAALAATDYTDDCDAYGMWDREKGVVLVRYIATVVLWDDGCIDGPARSQPPIEGRCVPYPPAIDVEHTGRPCPLNCAGIAVNVPCAVCSCRFRPVPMAALRSDWNTCTVCIHRSGQQATIPGIRRYLAE